MVKVLQGRVAVIAEGAKHTNCCVGSKHLLYVRDGICFKLGLFLLADPAVWGDVPHNCCTSTPPHTHSMHYLERSLIRGLRLTFCNIMHYGELYAPAGAQRLSSESAVSVLSSCRSRHGRLSCLSVLTPSAPDMRLMSPILYIWSAMLSDPFTLHRTHPVLFDVCTPERLSKSDSLYMNTTSY